MFDDVKKDDANVIRPDPGKVEDVFAETDPAPAQQAVEQRSAVQEGKLQPVQQPAQQVPPGQTQPPAPPQVPGQMQAPQAVGPSRPLTNLSQLEEYGRKRGSRRGIIIAIVILVVILGAVSVGAYFYFSSQQSENPPVEGNTNVNEGVINTNAVPLENENVAPPPPINQNTSRGPLDEPPSEILIDADEDGLTDLEEEALGTDPSDPDTDSDGLSDRDEFRAHKTNPLNSDSDNDGLSDRDELFVWRTNPNNADSDGDSYLDGEEVEGGYNPAGPGRLAPENLAQ